VAGQIGLIPSSMSFPKQLSGTNSMENFHLFLFQFSLAFEHMKKILEVMKVEARDLLHCEVYVTDFKWLSLARTSWNKCYAAWRDNTGNDEAIKPFDYLASIVAVENLPKNALVELVPRAYNSQWASLYSNGIFGASGLDSDDEGDALILTQQSIRFATTITLGSISDPMTISLNRIGNTIDIKSCFQFSDQSIPSSKLRESLTLSYNKMRSLLTEASHGDSLKSAFLTRVFYAMHDSDMIETRASLNILDTYP
jgi:enamine deaminase RidA (YjgF/YER057c/UK114 family)